MIITISGTARCGKNYVGNLLCEKLPNAKCYAFADLLKEYTCEMFGIDIETLDFYKNSTEPFTANGVTMRTILQRFGTEIFVNKVDRLYWVKKLKEKINSENYEYAIITDARFYHELDFIGESFKIFIKGNEEINERNHISEHGLENYNFDFEINNIDKPNLSPMIDEIYSIITKRN
jgi:hypothetical protein